MPTMRTRWVRWRASSSLLNTRTHTRTRTHAHSPCILYIYIYYIHIYSSFFPFFLFRPLIRIAQVAVVTSLKPLQNETSFSIPWGPVAPTNVKSFSALCYYFGRNMFSKLGASTPIGLVQAAVGGTYIQSFMPPKGYVRARACVCARTTCCANTNQQCGAQSVTGTLVCLLCVVLLVVLHAFNTPSMCVFGYAASHMRVFARKRILSRQICCVQQHWDGTARMGRRPYRSRAPDTLRPLGGAEPAVGVVECNASSIDLVSL